MRFSVTGPHKVDGALLTPDHPAWARVYSHVEAAMATVRSRGDWRIQDELTVGGAFGVDTIAALVGRSTDCPYIRLCAPKGKPYNEECEALAHGAEFVPGGYMKRNDALVAYADVLLAFPPTADEPPNPRVGGGTWATIRRARKAGIEVRLFPLFDREAFEQFRSDPRRKSLVDRILRDDE